MAVYATIADVARLAGLTYNANTPVTASDVAGFLTKAGAELDGLLAAKGYSVPISQATSPLSFALAGHWQSLAARALAEQAWPDSPNRDAAEQAWQAAREMLRAGDVDLPDAGFNLAARIAT